MAGPRVGPKARPRTSLVPAIHVFPRPSQRRWMKDAWSRKPPAVHQSTRGHDQWSARRGDRGSRPRPVSAPLFGQASAPARRSGVFAWCVMGSSTTTHRDAAHVGFDWMERLGRGDIVDLPRSPTELTQHSLPRGCRLPGADSHPLEAASFLAHPTVSFSNARAKGPRRASASIDGEATPVVIPANAGTQPGFPPPLSRGQAFSGNDGRGHCLCGPGRR
jgi:hypothetical protein